MENGSVERHDTYDARGLHLSWIPGTVEVRVIEGEQLEFLIEGLEAHVQWIERDVADGVLHVAGSRRNREYARSVIGDLRVVVGVPSGTPVTIETGLCGWYRVGDTNGSLVLRVDGMSEVVAGRVADVDLEVQDMGKLEIAAVVGRELRATVRDGGHAVVRAGKVEVLALTAGVVGTGIFGGLAQKAHLTTTDGGCIRVNVVTEDLTEQCSVTGRINVHVPPRRDPGTFWD